MQSARASLRVCAMMALLFAVAACVLAPLSVSADDPSQFSWDGRVRSLIPPSMRSSLLFPRGVSYDGKRNWLYMVDEGSEIQKKFGAVYVIDLNVKAGSEGSVLKLDFSGSGVELHYPAGVAASRVGRLLFIASAQMRAGYPKLETKVYQVRVEGMMDAPPAAVKFLINEVMLNRHMLGIQPRSLAMNEADTDLYLNCWNATNGSQPPYIFHLPLDQRAPYDSPTASARRMPWRPDADINMPMAVELSPPDQQSRKQEWLYTTSLYYNSLARIDMMSGTFEVEQLEQPSEYETHATGLALEGDGQGAFVLGSDNLYPNGTLYYVDLARILPLTGRFIPLELRDADTLKPLRYLRLSITTQASLSKWQPGVQTLYVSGEKNVYAVNVTRIPNKYAKAGDRPVVQLPRITLQ